ncbi:hypothetical protein V5799_008427 [Amblyomma americanum]|uniref:Uncharacterized protein n=1 Tax=Amblyomma americanum TaxID=6943 RepID=A0AAQ4FEY2_AMBAM
MANATLLYVPQVIMALATSCMLASPCFVTYPGFPRSLEMGKPSPACASLEGLPITGTSIASPHVSIGSVTEACVADYSSRPHLDCSFSGHGSSLPGTMANATLLYVPQVMALATSCMLASPGFVTYPAFSRSLEMEKPSPACASLEGLPITGTSIASPHVSIGSGTEACVADYSSRPHLDCSFSGHGSSLPGTMANATLLYVPQVIMALATSCMLASPCFVTYPGFPRSLEMGNPSPACASLEGLPITGTSIASPHVSIGSGTEACVADYSSRPHLDCSFSGHGSSLPGTMANATLLYVPQVMALATSCMLASPGFVTYPAFSRSLEMEKPSPACASLEGLPITGTSIASPHVSIGSGTEACVADYSSRPHLDCSFSGHGSSLPGTMANATLLYVPQVIMALATSCMLASPCFVTYPGFPRSLEMGKPSPACASLEGLPITGTSIASPHVSIGSGTEACVADYSSRPHLDCSFSGHGSSLPGTMANATLLYVPQVIMALATSCMLASPCFVTYPGFSRSLEMENPSPACASLEGLPITGTSIASPHVSIGSGTEACVADYSSRPHLDCSFSGHGSSLPGTMANATLLYVPQVIMALATSCMLASPCFVTYPGFPRSLEMGKPSPACASLEGLPITGTSIASPHVSIGSVTEACVADYSSRPHLDCSFSGHGSSLPGTMANATLLYVPQVMALATSCMLASPGFVTYPAFSRSLEIEKPSPACASLEGLPITGTSIASPNVSSGSGTESCVADYSSRPHLDCSFSGHGSSLPGTMANATLLYVPQVIMALATSCMLASPCFVTYPGFPRSLEMGNPSPACASLEGLPITGTSIASPQVSIGSGTEACVADYSSRPHLDCSFSGHGSSLPGTMANATLLYVPQVMALATSCMLASPGFVTYPAFSRSLEMKKPSPACASLEGLPITGTSIASPHVSIGFGTEACVADYSSRPHLDCSFSGHGSSLPGTMANATLLYVPQVMALATSCMLASPGFVTYPAFSRSLEMEKPSPACASLEGLPITGTSIASPHVSIGFGTEACVADYSSRPHLDCSFSGQGSSLPGTMANATLLYVPQVIMALATSCMQASPCFVTYPGLPRSLEMGNPLPACASLEGLPITGTSIASPHVSIGSGTEACVADYSSRPHLDCSFSGHGSSLPGTMANATLLYVPQVMALATSCMLASPGFVTYPAFSRSLEMKKPSPACASLEGLPITGTSIASPHVSIGFGTEACVADYSSRPHLDCSFSGHGSSLPGTMANATLLYVPQVMALATSCMLASPGFVTYPAFSRSLEMEKPSPACASLEGLPITGTSIASPHVSIGFGTEACVADYSSRPHLDCSFSGHGSSLPGTMANATLLYVPQVIMALATSCMQASPCFVTYPGLPRSLEMGNPLPACASLEGLPNIGTSIASPHVSIGSDTEACVADYSSRPHLDCSFSGHGSSLPGTMANATLLYVPQVIMALATSCMLASPRFVTYPGFSRSLEMEKPSPACALLEGLPITGTSIASPHVSIGSGTEACVAEYLSRPHIDCSFSGHGSGLHGTMVNATLLYVPQVIMAPATSCMPASPCFVTYPGFSRSLEMEKPSPECASLEGLPITGTSIALPHVSIGSGTEACVADYSSRPHLDCSFSGHGSSLPGTMANATLLYVPQVIMALATSCMLASPCFVTYPGFPRSLEMGNPSPACASLEGLPITGTSIASPHVSIGSGTEACVADYSSRPHLDCSFSGHGSSLPGTMANATLLYVPQVIMAPATSFMLASPCFVTYPGFSRSLEMGKPSPACASLEGLHITGTSIASPHVSIESETEACVPDYSSRPHLDCSFSGHGSSLPGTMANATLLYVPQVMAPATSCMLASPGFVTYPASSRSLEMEKPSPACASLEGLPITGTSIASPHVSIGSGTEACVADYSSRPHLDCSFSGHGSSLPGTMANATLLYVPQDIMAPATSCMLASPCFVTYPGFSRSLEMEKPSPACASLEGLPINGTSFASPNVSIGSGTEACVADYLSNPHLDCSFSGHGSSLPGTMANATLLYVPQVIMAPATSCMLASPCFVTYPAFSRSLEMEKPSPACASLEGLPITGTSIASPHVSIGSGTEACVADYSSRPHLDCCFSGHGCSLPGTMANATLLYVPQVIMALATSCMLASPCFVTYPGFPRSLEMGNPSPACASLEGLPITGTSIASPHVSIGSGTEACVADYSSRPHLDCSFSGHGSSLPGTMANATLLYVPQVMALATSCMLASPGFVTYPAFSRSLEMEKPSPACASLEGLPITGTSIASPHVSIGSGTEACVADYSSRPHLDCSFSGHGSSLPGSMANANLLYVPQVIMALATSCMLASPCFVTYPGFPRSLEMGNPSPACASLEGLPNTGTSIASPHVSIGSGTKACVADYSSRPHLDCSFSGHGSSLPGTMANATLLYVPQVMALATSCMLASPCFVTYPGFSRSLEMENPSPACASLEGLPITGTSIASPHVSIGFGTEACVADYSSRPHLDCSFSGHGSSLPGTMANATLLYVPQVMALATSCMLASPGFVTYPAFSRSLEMEKPSPACASLEGLPITGTSIASPHVSIGFGTEACVADYSSRPHLDCSFSGHGSSLPGTMANATLLYVPQVIMALATSCMQASPCFVTYPGLPRSLEMGNPLPACASLEGLPNIGTSIASPHVSIGSDTEACVADYSSRPHLDCSFSGHGSSLPGTMANATLLYVPQVIMALATSCMLASPRFVTYPGFSRSLEMEKPSPACALLEGLPITGTSIASPHVSIGSGTEACVAEYLSRPHIDCSFSGHGSGLHGTMVNATLLYVPQVIMAPATSCMPASPCFVTYPGFSRSLEMEKPSPECASLEGLPITGTSIALPHVSIGSGTEACVADYSSRPHLDCSFSGHGSSLPGTMANATLLYVPQVIMALATSCMLASPCFVTYPGFPRSLEMGNPSPACASLEGLPITGTSIASPHVSIGSGTEACVADYSSRPHLDCSFSGHGSSLPGYGTGNVLHAGLAGLRDLPRFFTVTGNGKTLTCVRIVGRTTYHRHFYRLATRVDRIWDGSLRGRLLKQATSRLQFQWTLEQPSRHHG